MSPGYRFPAIEEEGLPNGLHGLWLADREQPALTLAVQFPRGRLDDPQGLEGAAELGMALVQSGTRTLAHDEFMEELESTGSALFCDVGEEHTLLGCRLLAQHAGRIVPLFWEMVTAPALAGDELRRLSKEALTGLDAERAEPMSLAFRHFHALLFGPDHPAGRIQTHESVRRIGIAEATAAAKRICAPQGGSVVVAGSCGDEPGPRPWRGLFALWQAGGPAPAPATEAPAGPQPGVRIRLVDKPDLTQTTLVLGHLMPGEDHGERHAIALANYILGGGGFSSRLMAEVRGKLGEAYSVSSQVERCRRFGALTICTSTRNEQAGEMLDMVRAVYGRFVEEGVTEEELSKARGFACGNLAFQLEGAPRVAERLLWLRLHGRDRSEIEQYQEIVQGIGRASVNAAIRQYFTPGTLVVAAVGRREAVERQLAGAGTLDVRDYRAPAC